MRDSYLTKKIIHQAGGAKKQRWPEEGEAVGF